MPEVVAVAVAITVLVLFRHYAARQMLKRRGAFVWAFAFPMILGPAVITWAGLRQFSYAPIFGGLLLAFGVLLGAGEVLFFRKASRAVSAVAPGDDVGGVLLEQFGDWMVTKMVVYVFLGIVLGFALVVWAILNQGH